MAKTQTLKFKRTLAAPPAEVYRAFTSSTALREWFCDVAVAQAQPGSVYFFAWNRGYYATGEFTKLVAGRKVSFTWLGRGEPGPTEVRVSIEEQDGGSAVTVAHAGIGTGKKWADHAQEIGHGWETALENLESVLSTGQDLRFTMRPMLGISGLEAVTPELVQRLGLPVDRGVRIEGTVAGMGAEAAGLLKDDVVVNLAGHKIANYPSLLAALQGQRAGDEVPVTIYRGSEKHKLTMRLSKRPLPDVPETAAALADAVRAIYAKTDAELAQALDGMPETVADFRPGPNEWTVKEIMGHLIGGERDTQQFVSEIAAGQERHYDQFPGNDTNRVKATAAAYGTLPALLDELRHAEAETVALLAGLPPEFVARRGSYWRTGLSLVQTADHVHEHLGQIRAAAQAAQAAQAAAEGQPAE